MSDKQDTVAVILDSPGIQAVGAYRAGQVYHVDPVEAERLIQVKGFRKARKHELTELTEQER